MALAAALALCSARSAGAACPGDAIWLDEVQITPTLILQGTITTAAWPLADVHPNVDGVLLTLSDADGHVLTLPIPPRHGWRSRSDAGFGWRGRAHGVRSIQVVPTSELWTLRVRGTRLAGALRLGSHGLRVQLETGTSCAARQYQ